MDTDRRMIPCRWQVEFHITPSLHRSETIKSYDFEVRDGLTYVKIIYETSAFDKILPDRKTDYEYAEQTLAYRDASSIRNLMLARMIYQRVVKPLKVEIVSGPTLLNKNELSGAGLLKIRTVGKSVSIKYNILDVGNSLKESDNFWQSGFKNKIVGRQVDILRIIDWLQRAETESDTIKSFILAWIGFNGLYGLFALIFGDKQADDASKFEYMIDKLLQNGAHYIVHRYRNLLDVLESYNLRSAKGNINWSDKLKNERRKRNGCDLTILKYVVRCIYSVRKGIFHEAPEPNDINKRADHSKSILMPIVLTCLRNFVTY